MTPSHAVKQHKRYRYYVSQIESHDDIAAPAWRISATELETTVIEELKATIGRAVQTAVAGCTMDSHAIEILHDRCAAAVAGLSQDAPFRRREHPINLIQRIDMDERALRIAISLSAIDEHLAGEHNREVDITMVRTGRQTKIIIPPPASHKALPNPSLLKLVAQAFIARAEMDKGGSFSEVADRLGCGREYLADLLRTSYLAPSIIRAIVEGRQPPELSRKQLMQTNRIPLDWRGQEQLFGFG